MGWYVRVYICVKAKLIFVSICSFFFAPFPYVDIVQRLCKYLPTLCTGKYLHNIYVYG